MNYMCNKIKINKQKILKKFFFLNVIHLKYHTCIVCVSYVFAHVAHLVVSVRSFNGQFGCYLKSRIKISYLKAKKSMTDHNTLQVIDLF